MTTRKQALAAATLAALVVTWLVVFAAVPPALQDFPLNDDGLYNVSLQDWLHGRGIHYYGWASIPQLGQWVWAAPFASMVRPAFVATRLSTIVLSILGAIAFYALLRRERQASGAAAAVGMLLLAFNPLYMMLSATFMTDVPSLAFSLIALLWFSIGLERSPAWLLGALVAALAAVTSRQNAIVVPVVMLYAIWRQRSWRTNPLASAVAIVTLAVSVSIVLWFGSRPDIVHFTPKIPGLDQVVLVVGSACCYLGLFVLPLAVLGMRGRHFSEWTPYVILAALVALGWAGYTRAIDHQPFTSAMFPAVGNMLTVHGTFGSNYMAGVRALVFPTWLRVLLTLAGAVGVAALFHQGREEWRGRRWPDLLTLYGVLQIPFLFISFTYFDRYLVALLPSVLGLAVSMRRPSRADRAARATAAALCAVIALFSVALVHDWLAWNSARWQLGRDALASGIRAEEIEGGFEWDNLFAIPEGRWRLDPQRPAQGLTLRYHATMFDGMTGRCALSFSALPGTATISSREYQAWLGWERRQFVLACRP